MGVMAFTGPSPALAISSGTYCLGLLVGWFVSLRIAGVQIVVQPTVIFKPDPHNVVNKTN